MKVRDLIRELLGHDMDAEVFALDGSGLEHVTTFFKKKGLVALGTGTYGRDNPRFARLYRAFRRRRAPVKSGFIRGPVRDLQAGREPLMAGVSVGQVWLYLRDAAPAPVVHVVSRVDGEVCESTSVFPDGTANERITLSGPGCDGVGMSYMRAGRDGIGSWTLLYSPPEVLS